MYCFPMPQKNEEKKGIPSLKGCESKEKRDSKCVGGKIMCVCIFCPISFCSSWSYHKSVLRHIIHTVLENAVSFLVFWDRKWPESWTNTAGFPFDCKALLPSAQLLPAYLWGAGSAVRIKDTLYLQGEESTVHRTVLTAKISWAYQVLAWPTGIFKYPQSLWDCVKMPRSPVLL